MVKTKEYKIPRCKKCTSYKKCSFYLKKFPTQKDLNDHTSIDHDNYHFLCKHRKCGKSFISEGGLKRHELQHSSMDYKCTVCSREFATKPSTQRKSTSYASTQGVMGQSKQKQSTRDIIKLMGLPVMITGVWYITKHLTNVNIQGNTKRYIQENCHLHILFVEASSNGEVGGIITCNQSTKTRKV